MPARFSLVLLLLLGMGCGQKDPVENAIQRLGGSESEVRNAVMDLRLTSHDPVPGLIKAIRNPQEKPRVRVAAVGVLGDIARRQNHPQALSFLHELLRADDPKIREAAVRGFIETEYPAAVPDLIALKAGASPELREALEEALATTARKWVKDTQKLWNSPGAALAAYEKAEAIGLDRGLMGYSKARFLEMRGRTDEANAKYDALGFIRRWWIIGPFPNRQGMGFRQVYPPEHEIDLRAAYPSALGKISWYRLERNLPGALLDFEAYFVETDNVVGYTLVYLVSDTERTVEVRAGSDDTLQLFLNHELVWAHEEYRGVNFDDDVVPITLKKGVNSLVFKVCEDWGGWQLQARITGPGDTPLEGVEITLDPGGKEDG